MSEPEPGRDRTIKCIECDQQLGSFHRPGCGKRVTGCPCVVLDDCLDEDEPEDEPEEV